MGEKRYKYLYGPVPSRRLGISLGIDVIPSKYCSYNCVYCQVKKTDHLTVSRKSFYPVEEILEETEHRLSEVSSQLDCITFSGSGEPTLNINIGDIIRGIKRITSIPIVIITNGSLLWMQDVREDLKEANIVVPSMDSVIESSFRKVNRPHSSLDLDLIKKGLMDFRSSFEGRFWLEILLVSGINDTDDDIIALAEFVNELKPERVHLNTVSRPPAEESAKPLSVERLSEIADHFNPKAELVESPHSEERGPQPSPVKKEEIIEMLRRRPCTIDDIYESLHYRIVKIEKALNKLERKGLIKKRQSGRKIYYSSRY